MTSTIPTGDIRRDPAIQQRAGGLAPGLVDEYAESIGTWIEAAPVTVFRGDTGTWCADGFHRLEAATRAGLTAVPCTVRAGGRRDALLYACGANAAHGARRTAADKRRAVETLLNDPEWASRSDRWIADAARVSPTTVGTLRAELSKWTVGDLPPADAPAPSAAVLDLPDDGESCSPFSEAAPAQSPGVLELPTTRIGLDGKARVVPHVAHNAGNVHWHTPPEYIAAARKALGRIDLDPASNAIAQETVRAARYYAREHDGLSLPWAGKVFLNPPYAQPEIGLFADKLAAEVKAGTVEAAIVLVNNASDTAWFQRLVSVSSAVCFPRGRVRFLTPQGEPGAPLQGQSVFYIGADVERFARAFGVFGPVLQEVQVLDRPSDRLQGRAAMSETPAQATTT